MDVVSLFSVEFTNQRIFWRFLFPWPKTSGDLMHCEYARHGACLLPKGENCVAKWQFSAIPILGDLAGGGTEKEAIPTVRLEIGEWQSIYP